MDVERASGVSTGAAAAAASVTCGTAAAAAATAAGDANPPTPPPSSAQACDSTMANALAKLIEQQMQTQYEEHRKKMEALQAKMESQLLEKQAVLFQALRSGAPFGTLPSFAGSFSRGGASGSGAYLLSGPCAPGGHEVPALPQCTTAIRRVGSCGTDGELSLSLYGPAHASRGAVSPVTSDADGESNASSGTGRFRAVATSAAGEAEEPPPLPSSSTDIGRRVNLDPCWPDGGGSRSDRDCAARPVALLRLSSVDGDGCHEIGEAVTTGAGRLDASTPTAPVQRSQLRPPTPDDELPSCETSQLHLPDHCSSVAQRGGGSSSSSVEGELLSQSIHLPVPAVALLAAGSTSALSDDDARSGTTRNWLDRIAHPDGGPVASFSTMATAAAALPNGYDKEEVARTTKMEVSGSLGSRTACAGGGSPGHASDGSSQEPLSGHRGSSASSTMLPVQAAVTSQSTRNKDSRPAADSRGAMLSGDGHVKAAKPAAEEPPPPLALSDLSALRTPDEEDDLSTSLRLSLRQKHARQLANLRCYYEEEMDNLRCHMSSHEFLVMQEPYKKLLAENERLQQRTRLLDEELTRAYRYITSVDKQMSALENTVRLITLDSKQSPSEESKELGELRLRHTALQEDYDGLVGSHSSLQKTLKSSQEALQASRKEQELLRVSLAQLRAEKQLLHEESETLRLELKRSLLLSAGGPSREPADRDDTACERSSSTELQSSPPSAGESGARHVVGAAAVRASVGVNYQPSSTGAARVSAAADARLPFASPSKEAWSWSADREPAGRPFRSSASSPSMAYFVPSSVFSDVSDKESRSEPVRTARSQDVDRLGHVSRRPQPADFSRAGRQRAAVQAPVSDQVTHGAAAASAALGLGTPVLTDRGIRGTAVGGNADDDDDKDLQPHAMPTGGAAAAAAVSSRPARGAEHLATTAAAAAAAASHWPPGAAAAVKHSSDDSTHPAGRSSAVTQQQQQQSCAAPPQVLSPQQPAALLQAYSPAASSSVGVQRRSSGDTADASCSSHVRPGCRRPSSERRPQPGSSSSMPVGSSGSGSVTSSEPLVLTQQRQSFGGRGSMPSDAVGAAALLTDASTRLSPSRDERLLALAGTQHGKKSPGEKKAKATQTPSSAADARKQPQRRSPARRSLHASLNASGPVVQLPADNHPSSLADSTSSAASTERVNSWIDVTAGRSRFGAASNCSQEVGAALSPGGTVVAASASLSERVRLMHDLELRLDELLSEKRELEAILSRMPITGGNLQERLRKEEVEQQLDSVDRNLGSVRIALRRYKAL